MVETSRRQYYRVVYPITARPQLVVKDVACEVMDCSETGLCFLTPDNVVAPVVGEAFNGVIRFQSGEEISVAGKVVRVNWPAVGVSFNRNKGIPFAVILEEQRYLRKLFLKQEEK